jgi:hypothetical protein
VIFRDKQVDVEENRGYKRQYNASDRNIIRGDQPAGNKNVLP